MAITQRGCLLPAIGLDRIGEKMGSKDETSGSQRSDRDGR